MSEWIDNASRASLQDFVSRSNAPMLVSQADGPILWSNAAFQKLVGHSDYELHRTQNPNSLTWVDLSVPDSGLQADEILAQRALRGEISEYSIIKYYKVNGGVPVRCHVHVKRFPAHVDQDVEVFLVTVIPLSDGACVAVDEVERLSQKLSGSLNVFQESLSRVNERVEQLLEVKHTSVQTLALAIASFVEEHPRQTFFLLAALGLAIFGEGFLGWLATLKQVTP